MLKNLFALALLLTVVPFAGWTDTGKPAPDFSVKDINGNSQSISQYKGRIIVLEWNNPDCPFVGKHYGSGNMQKLQNYAKLNGVIWLTVNSGGEGKERHLSADEAKAMIAKVGGNEAAYILDPHGKIGHLYGATATPNMFVIDVQGNIAYQGAIDDKPTADQGDIKTAHNYVQSAVDSLLAGKPVEVSETKPYGCSVKYSE